MGYIKQDTIFSGQVREIFRSDSAQKVFDTNGKIFGGRAIF